MVERVGSCEGVKTFKRTGYYSPAGVLVRRLLMKPLVRDTQKILRIMVQECI
jgi:hypothetical protein